MDPYDGVNVGMIVCQLDRLPAARNIVADDNEPSDARIPSALKDVFPVLVELSVLQMTMRVDEHVYSPSLASSSSTIDASSFLKSGFGSASA